MKRCPAVSGELSYIRKGGIRWSKNSFTGGLEQKYEKDKLLIFEQADIADDARCSSPGTAIEHRFKKFGMESGCKYWDKVNKKCLVCSEEESEKIHTTKIEQIKQLAKEMNIEFELVTR